MEELRFGKTDDEVQDNPAVLMARKTMKDYMKDADVVKRHGPASNLPAARRDNQVFRMWDGVQGKKCIV